MYIYLCLSSDLSKLCVYRSISQSVILTISLSIYLTNQYNYECLSFCQSVYLYLYIYIYLLYNQNLKHTHKKTQKQIAIHSPPTTKKNLLFHIEEIFVSMVCPLKKLISALRLIYIYIKEDESFFFSFFCLSYEGFI